MSRPVFRRSRMNRRRYLTMTLRHASPRSKPSAPCRHSPPRHTPHSGTLSRPSRPISRNGRVALGLSLAILSFPLMASCDRTSTPNRPAPPATVPTPPAPPAKPSRTITFQGLNNDFRGSTTVLPDDRVIHHKEPP